MSLRRLLVVSVALLCLFGLSASAQAAPVIDLPEPVTPEPYPGSDIYPALVYLPNRADLELLQALKIDVDDLRLASGGRTLLNPDRPYQPLVATVYVNPSEAQLLAQNGLEVIPIPNEGYRAFLAYGPGTNQPGSWPTYEQLEGRMGGLPSTYPGLVNLHAIGASFQGRNMWCLEISDNVGTPENEPEFRYISTMHGDELTGVEMTLRLAELLLSSYGVDPDLTALVDGMEIWICPVVNPDGYVNGTRNNAQNYDLNRNFPDRFDDPADSPAGHPKEVQVYWQFGKDHHFVMGANYHGGAQVANVPWDAIDLPPIYAPDDGIFLDWARGYAALNIDLLNGGFTDGVTRGWQWYEIYGGLQDYSYYYNGEHHITLEISNTKAPPYNTMPTYWEHNREAMLYWMSQALTGMHGLVLDAATSAPLTATLTIQGMDMPNFIRTDPAVGDYHRVIGAGTYTLVAAVEGYESITHTVTISDGQATTQNFYLCPQAMVNLSGSITAFSTGLPLQGNIEILGAPFSPVPVQPDGSYETQVCPASYTLRASADGYIPQERTVTITTNSVEDFALLLQPDLVASTKTASAASALPSEVLTYTIVADNATTADAIAITDTLPTGLNWAGVLTATRGLPAYADGQITWSGVLTPGQPLTITYSVSVAACLPGGITLTNLAEFENGYGLMLPRTAALQILNAAPDAPALLTPAQDADEQPWEITLTWQASTDLNCDPLTYTLYLGAETPLPVASSLTTTTFTVSDLLPGVTYSWYVVASDGQVSTASPVWHFTTTPLRFFIPYISRNG